MLKPGIVLATLTALMTALFAPAAHAQATENVLYSFCSQGASNCTDGEYAVVSLVFDSKGSLYGTTDNGGTGSACGYSDTDIGCGTVFELSPPSGGSGPWTETVLWSFGATQSDGFSPYSSPTFDSHGNLYGTTQAGNLNGGGIAFELSPPIGGSGPWTEALLYSFCSQSNCTDGKILQAGLIFDSHGNLYGETLEGGATNAGTVFELSPPSGGSGPWTENVLWSFGASGDGRNPNTGLIFDSKGNLYGTNSYGGANGTACNGDGCGTVFELSPPSGGSGPWTENVLWSFGAGSDGQQPISSLIFDSHGNLYGTTFGGGANGAGTVFELTPPSAGSGPWTENVLWSFGAGSDGSNPDFGSLIFDSQGNLYGTNEYGGANGMGTVFELSPPSGGSGPWTERVLWSFDGSDGATPVGSVISNSQGNLYGTTYFGGAVSCRNPNGCGTVFELPTPKTATTTSLTSSPDPSTIGQTVTFTATVSGSSPTGTVDFTSNGSTISGCSVVTLSSGAAACSTTTLPAGADAIVATYSGDSGNAGSTSNTVSQVVNKVTSSAVLISSANPSTVGQSVTFTATISPETATGTVMFAANSTTISGCSAVTLSSGVAACTTSALLGGTNPIVATYSGDSNYGPSTSNTVSQAVNPVSTTTRLVSSQNPSSFGRPVTFTATVSGVSPTGTVGFTANGTTVTGCSAETLSSGMAACATSALAAGTDAIVATYSGDSNNGASTSNTVAQVVKPPTTTNLVSSQNPSTFGQLVTFTASVNGASPTGTVGFTANGASISGCSALTLSSGTSACSTSSLPVGTGAIVATYSGDSNNSGSTSNTLSQVVNKITSSTALSSSANPTSIVQPVTFTATISPGTATGTVAFTSNSTVITGCAAVTLTSGAAGCTTSYATIGTYGIVASYSGDASDAGSTSSTLSQVINCPSCDFTLAAVPQSVYVVRGNNGTSTVTTGALGYFNAAIALSASGQPAGVTVTLNPASIPAPGNGTSTMTIAVASTTATGTYPILLTAIGGGKTHTYAMSLVVLATQVSTTSVVTSAPNPSTGGQTVALTGTVSASEGGTPTGSVTFKSAGSSIGTVPLVSGVATLNDGSLTASGSPHSVTATYNGSALDAASTSAAISQVVNFDSTTTTLATSPNPSTPGSSVTLTATVTPGNGVTATGTVSFYSGSTQLGNASLSGGVASLSHTFTAGGAYSLSAKYTGSNYKTASTSNTVTQAVGAASATTLASSLNPSTAGVAVTFTATVTPAGPPTPTGTVAFSTNGATIAGCSAVTLTASRTAACATTTLAAGTDAITAVYSGDSNYQTSTSAALSQVVNKAASSTALASSLNPSALGQLVTFTATVTGDAPTGTVGFTANGTTLSGCSAVALASGAATCSTSTLALGTASIVAVYSGDNSNLGSSSGTFSQVVNEAVTTTALTSNLNPSTGGQTVTFTATVTASGGGTPAGTITFYNGSTSIGVMTLSASVAKLNYSALVAGTHSITATYNGSATDATSTSPVVSQVVNLDTTTTALTTSPNPSTSGQSVTMTATVTPGNGVAATGTVSFYSGSTLVGNVSLSGGVATLSHAFTTGTYSLTAKYAGSNYKSGSTSSVVTQTVSAAASRR